MDLKTILETIDRDLLTEDTMNKIQTAFNEAVDKKVDERLELTVESALMEMDEDHARKMKRFINAIDEDHTAKLESVVEAIEHDHMGKLKRLVSKYNKEITESAKHHINVLTEELSNYLDSYIEELIPADVVTEAAKNYHAQTLLKEAKSILAVDEKLASKEFRHAIKDGANQIQNLTEENKKLKRKQALFESNRLLEKLTTNMPLGKSNFIKKRLDNKSPRFIKENFSLWKECMKNKILQTSLIYQRLVMLIVETALTMKSY